MKVGVLDYGVGNLGSVMRALEELRVTPILIDRALDMHIADCLILPGVGSFTDCKKLLDKGGWTSALKDEVAGYSKPLLGICLGMQLLADVGMEGAEDEDGTPGLGFIPGKVESLSNIGCKSRVPHMGWNEITATNHSNLLSGIPDGTDFYFVHSYAFVTQNPNDIFAITDYDVPVTAVVGKGHVWGVQFHPEKSSRAGLKVLRNFIEGPAC
jgi:imidazole glycerol-phosphate synthase subunit HisH